MEIQGYTPNPNSDIYPAARPDFILAIKILAGISSSLSIIGACLIILTYMFCGRKWKRSGEVHDHMISFIQGARRGGGTQYL